MPDSLRQPVRFTFRLAAAAAVAGVVLAAAVSAHAQPAKAPQGAATAQAALDGLEAAIAASDMKGAMAFLTPAGHKALAQEAVGGTLMFLAFMDPDDTMPGTAKPSPAELAKKRDAYNAAKTAITAAMKPSGLDAAIGKPVMQEATQTIVTKGLAAADPAVLVPALFAAVMKAGSALGIAEKPKFPIKLGPLANLKVDGDRATVKSGAKTVHLEKINGKWLVNLPVPEMQEPPPE